MIIDKIFRKYKISNSFFELVAVESLCSCSGSEFDCDRRSRKVVFLPRKQSGHLCKKKCKKRTSEKNFNPKTRPSVLKRPTKMRFSHSKVFENRKLDFASGTDSIQLKT